MANTIVIMGLVIAILGKLVAVGYLFFVEHAKVAPLVALVLAGYVMLVAGGLAGGTAAF